VTEKLHNNYLLLLSLISKRPVPENTDKKEFLDEINKYIPLIQDSQRKFLNLKKKSRKKKKNL
jgi:hypothetical protein